MLNYSVKLSDKYINKDVVVWGEKYLSPDLSFISGVTSQDYHLENQTQIEASIGGKSDILNIECENVIREGFIIVKGKKYKKENGAFLINGKYYYEKSSKITINDWLVPRFSIKNDYNNGKRYVPGVTSSTASYNVSGNYALVDTIYWIENGKVNIDGNEYFFDKDEVSNGAKGALKYFEDGQSLPAIGVTDCTSIEFYPIEDATDFLNVTKFRLTKEDNNKFEVDEITFISHFFYALRGDEIYPIELSAVTKDDVVTTYYVCTIDGTTYKVKYYEDRGYSAGEDATTDEINDYEGLLDYDCYVYMSDKCKIRVQNTVQNANGGRKIGIYLTNPYENIRVGEIITARRDVLNGLTQFKIDLLDGKYFIVNDGTRYDVVADMMNTVTIDEVEYDIKRCDGTNCFVEIEGEEVPMKKVGNTLERYGLVVKNTDKVPEKATYNIKSYSGVTIGGVNYRIVTGTDETNTVISLQAEASETYKLRVLETIGSSLIVCEPALYEKEFSSDYVSNKIIEIADNLVSNQNEFTIYKKNKLFGEREVLPGNAKVKSDDPTSSDNFQNVLGTLQLYANIGYINIPIKLEAEINPNQLIDDIRDKDFAEYETQKAINPIVDMERDVYVPKYIENSDESISAFTNEIGYTGDTEALRHAYIGSFTDFKPIIEIQVNPHFRTRDMSSWKVNDGYNNASASGKTDNWFVTDYEPYKSILTATTGDAANPEQLIEVADILGLLYFSNIDVYYQKTAVAKTFLRFSYYDGTNPQTQSLLHTSTVFMNEHNLFKKFIDNSRKNIYDYMIAQEPTLEIHGETTGDEPVYETHPSILNKISVMSEFIGIHDKKKIKATEDGYKFTDAKPLDEDRRISSRFTIFNKYQTDTSSEGFYLYIFKQYAENLHAKPIYMKIDFNHAKIGKTIPFNIPMKWAHSAQEVEDSPYVYPTERITLSNEPNTGDTGDTGSTSDLELLKEGIPLSYVYGQGYIPIYAMYDFKNKEYSYIFDERYVGKITDGIVKLNVFELKVKNNEDGDTVEKTAVIDINEKQIII